VLPNEGTTLGVWRCGSDPTNPMNVQRTTAPRCFKSATRDVNALLFRAHDPSLRLLPDVVSGPTPF